MNNILVIEDDTSVKEILRDALEMENYKVLTADHGLAALEICKTFQPDLVISDIMMPYMDGFELLKAFQRNSKTATIPFIFLTAKSGASDMRQGMTGGADDYITKPFKIKELLEAVDTRLKKKKKFDEVLARLTENISHHVPHELRTPLVAIMGYSDILLNEYKQLSEKEQVGMYKSIKDAGNRLYNTIEKFLVYSELTIILNDPSKRPRQFFGTTSVSDDSIKVAVWNQLLNSGRGTDLIVSCEESRLEISELNFSLLLNEIVENSIKFSTPGSPIKIFGRNKKKNYVLEISDTGIGMTREQVEQLAPFIQYERNGSVRDGNGLGLAIVQKLAQLYDMKVDIESEYRKFTTVRLTFLLN